MTARGHVCVHGCGPAASGPAPVAPVHCRAVGAGRGGGTGGRAVVVSAAAAAAGGSQAGGGAWAGATAGPGQTVAGYGGAPSSSSAGNSSGSSGGGAGSSGNPHVLSAATEEQRLASLRSQLEEAGVDLPEDVVASPGTWRHRTCPICGGGEGGHDPNSFSMFLSENYTRVSYLCRRQNKCGVKATVWAAGVNRKLSRAGAEGGALTEVPPAPARPELQREAQEPLDADALAFFAARGITAATLRAAGVYQARDVPHPTLPGVRLPRVVVYPYTLHGVVTNATFHDIHNYCLTVGLDEQEQGEGEGEGADEDAGEPARPPPVAPQPDPELLAILPGLRWQVAGAQRYLWGLDDVAFAPELQRHREKLAAARRPPMAKPRQAAAASPGADSAAATGAAGAGGPSGAPALTPGLERLAGAPSMPPVSAELNPAAAAAIAAASLQPTVAHSSAQAAQLDALGLAGGGGEAHVDEAGAVAGAAAGDGVGDGVGKGDHATPYDATDPSQDRESVRDMGDEEVELLPEEAAQWRGRGRFNDEDEAEAADEMELEFEGEEDEEEEDEAEEDDAEEDEAGEEDEEGEEGEEGEEDEDEEEDEEEEGEQARTAAGLPGMAPQGASAPPLGAPYAYGPFAAAAGAGDPRSQVAGASAASVAAPTLLHPRYRDLVLVEDELERLALMEAGVLNVLSLPPRAVVAFHDYTEALREAEAADEAATAAAAASGAGGRGGRRRGRGTSAAAATAVGMSATVLSYMFNSREVLSPESAVVGGEVRVTLALKEDAASRMLAEELANSLVRERCLVLRWPATQLELPPLSRELLQRQAAAAQAMAAAAAGTGDWGAVAHEMYEEVPEYLRAEEEEAEREAAWGSEPLGTEAAAAWGGSQEAAAPWAAAHQHGQYDQYDPYQQQPYQQGGGESAGTDDALVDAGGALAAGPPQAEQGGPIRVGAGDVLLRDGPEALTWLVEQGARPYPVKGLMDISGLWDEIIRHWHGKEATAAAVSTGWPGLDEVYRVTPGELTIVTGVPNSGKSHWLDALAVQLASAHEWRVGFASFEKSAVKHGQNLIELAARTSMFTPGGLQNMTPQQFHTALDWVNAHFFLIRHPDMADEGSAAPTPEQLRLAEGLRLGLGQGLGAPGAGAPGQPTPDELEAAERAAAWLEESRQPCTIDWVLSKATQAVYRHGIRGLVIDPYNELDQQRGAQSETEYISAMLSKVKRWAQRHMVHVWLVAHPKSFEDWDGSPPSMYDISGSAHWYNKADMGVVVHRYTRVAMDAAMKKYAGAAGGSAQVQATLERLRRKPVALSFSENETLIKVVKARNKTSGTQGDYVLNYSRERCRFLDPNFPDA
ncbi:hypothetical protein HXX76_000415 [Chlamydomonas incerta]|uniref:SF4 helicase domain-containing protein n=1 Tax=Chlamydomonas incerta TaxID=51695 RepID=A0A835WEB2_CHLIN|nr:hypothetical protein HXX76_000415 [Chlamydomonas incerta]|eukprot:KAG2445811.1 hypothetical protein HXX76_000415 [Chlamydomonas incerta]